MIVESGTCYDRFEFLIIFSAFAQKCGWSVNKQSKTELYLKNSYGNYLQIMLDYINVNGAFVALFAGATGFDENKDFENQPGYSRTNQNLIYKTAAQITTALFFNYSQNADHDMQGYTLVGDSDTLFCNMELYPNATYSFFSSNLKKFHDFNGGHIIFSDCFAGYGPYGPYNGMKIDGKCIKH